MERCSFENQCDEKVLYICRCANPQQYFCDIHINRHLRSPGDHLTESMMIELNHNQTTELLTKLKDFTKYLKERRKGLMDSSKTLIECIEKETRRALNSIKDLQKGVVDLMSERSIRKENYQVITNMTLENDNNISKQVEKIKESVEIRARNIFK